MQYFKPEGENTWVGDCMPFFHDGTFHLFYLLDRDHHQADGGLGGHQWAHATSADLIHWTHHPLAVPLTEDWEASICTGSAFFHDGTYYAFYATRMRDRTQHLSLATSRDGIHFEKVQPNPFSSPPPGYSAYHWRDPIVFHDDGTGLFHMLVTAWLEPLSLRGPRDRPCPFAGQGIGLIPDRAGCLARLVSEDLRNWEVREPFLVPGLVGPPECPDHFEWNGWYYLLFSHGLVTHYRMSRHPFGPWLRPTVDILDSPAARVMKTSPFTGGRRIGVAWLGTREGDRDDGRFQWAGHTVFREIIQHEDGTLGTRFPPEMIPPTSDLLALPFATLTSGVTGNARRIRLEATEGLGVAMLSEVPRDVRITDQVKPISGSGDFGLRLRGSGGFESGYDLRFSPSEGTMELHDQRIFAVDRLNRPFVLDVIVRGDIIDVCFDNRRCLINRCPELDGDRLFFFALNADVVFDAIEIRPL